MELEERPLEETRPVDDGIVMRPFADVARKRNSDTKPAIIIANHANTDMDEIMIYNDLEAAAEQQEDNTDHSTSTGSTSSVSRRQAIKELADKKVICGKLFMLAVLSLSTATVSSAVFMYLRRTEEDSFEKRYSNDVDKVFRQLRQTLDLTIEELDTYVVNLMAYNPAETWPYVTVPDFAVQAAKIRGVTKGFQFAQYHRLPTDLATVGGPWEVYTAANEEWVNETLEIQLDDPTFRGKRIASYNGSSSPLSLSPNPGRDKNDQPMYFPKWQSSPLVPAWEPYNWDLNRLEIFVDTIFPDLLQHKATVSPASNVPLSDAKDDIKIAEGNTEWFEDLLDTSLNDPASPASEMYYPILSYAADAVSHQGRNTSENGVQDTDEIIGLVSLSFFWKDLFEDILPVGSDGIVTVVSNTCGQSFTFELNGPDATLLGLTDVHDLNYNKMRQSVLLHVNPENSTALPLGNELCNFEVTAYPSDRFRDRFYTNDPIIFSVAVILTFVLSAAVFLLYDCFVEARQRSVQFNELCASSDAEKAKLIIDNARQATKTERELNDFIAHEVRNPVSAAMTACSFVKNAVNAQHIDSESMQTVREDVQVIDHSLNFVADLLRNMLDMHRAADKKLKISLEPVDILHDILEPTGGMLYRRGDHVKLLIDCPSNLIVETDRLRLKQIVLNLGRNSSKFISQGFIRLRARVDAADGTVEISVEDSGSGVPAEKREVLFSKFQDSLDVLSQGTGIGLFLCKNLTELLGGEIFLDQDFDSGIDGYPGTKIVIRLNKQPSEVSVFEDGQQEEASKGEGGWTPAVVNDDSETARIDPAQVSLPENQRVLFVDDDAMLRKLFSRSIKRAAPTWTCEEAGNGEAALLLTETERFDIIFMDMYMASVEKQLLGSETVAELRNKGVTCYIFGLSANDKEEEFLKSGADGFVFKPFPCKTDLLQQELVRLLSVRTPALQV